MAKDNGLVDKILPLVLTKMVIDWEVYAAQLCLYDQTTFMGVEGKVDFDGIFDAVGIVDLSPKLLFCGSDPDFVILLSMSNDRKLDTSAPYGYGGMEKSRD